ncbi:MAG: hypothetical protein P9L99_15615 [Candidatus Lernaella stagnicola]|nr:hypothetical protein [Candidatus Lernaella stagnicola]
MNAWRLALSILLALCLAGTVVGACDDDDDDNDDNNDSSPADDDDDDDNDDDDNNDDTSPIDDDDDDNDDDDDDTTPADYSCDEVADGLFNTCAMTLNDIHGVAQGEDDLEQWCGLSEELFTAKTVAPFWNCMGVCSFDEDCETACLDACLNPPDPGTGCATAVHGVYACGVAFVFVGTPLYIPEMDLQAVCGDYAVVDWTCAQGCVDSLTCSNPPTAPETMAMITCLGDC